MSRRVRRSSPAVIVGLGALGFVVGRSVRPVLEAADQVPPTVPWAAALILVFLAGVLGSLAWSTHQAVHKNRQRITSERGVRLLALAKASVIVGALAGGYYLGYALSYVGDLDIALPRERATHGAAAGVAALVMMVAGLLLERSCEIPRPDDDEGATAG